MAYHHQDDVIGFCGDYQHPHGCIDATDVSAKEQTMYALKQPHPDGSEWIQEFDSREEAVSFQSHSGGTLVKRERLPGQPGLWWVDVTERNVIGTEGKR